jgi:protein-S-isoprenylcysteine O-methyltransferase Ste14
MFQLKIAIGVLLVLVAYCAGARRIDLWPGWCFAGFFLVILAGSGRALARVAPDLVAERVSWHEGVMQWDKPIVTWLMFAPIVTSLVAGLDAHRNGIDGSGVSFAVGYVLAIGGAALTQSAITANRFYTSVVRVQKERGHEAVDSGPYRLIRHPGNLAARGASGLFQA